MEDIETIPSTSSCISSRGNSPVSSTGEQNNRGGVVKPTPPPRAPPTSGLRPSSVASTISTSSSFSLCAVATTTTAARPAVNFALEDQEEEEEVGTSIASEDDGHEGIELIPSPGEIQQSALSADENEVTKQAVEISERTTPGSESDNKDSISEEVTGAVVNLCQEKEDVASLDSEEKTRGAISLHAKKTLSPHSRDGITTSVHLGKKEEKVKSIPGSLNAFFGLKRELKLQVEDAQDDDDGCLEKESLKSEDFELIGGGGCEGEFLDEVRSNPQEEKDEEENLEEKESVVSLTGEELKEIEEASEESKAARLNSRCLSSKTTHTSSEKKRKEKVAAIRAMLRVRAGQTSSTSPLGTTTTTKTTLHCSFLWCCIFLLLTAFLLLVGYTHVLYFSTAAYYKYNSNNDGDGEDETVLLMEEYLDSLCDDSKFSFHPTRLLSSRADAKCRMMDSLGASPYYYDSTSTSSSSSAAAAAVVGRYDMVRYFSGLCDLGSSSTTPYAVVSLSSTASACKQIAKSNHKKVVKLGRCVPLSYLLEDKEADLQQQQPLQGGNTSSETYVVIYCGSRGSVDMRRRDWYNAAYGDSAQLRQIPVRKGGTLSFLPSDALSSSSSPFHHQLYLLKEKAIRQRAVQTLYRGWEAYTQNSFPFLNSIVNPSFVGSEAMPSSEKSLQDGGDLRGKTEVFQFLNYTSDSIAPVPVAEKTQSPEAEKRYYAIRSFFTNTNNKSNQTHVEPRTGFIFPPHYYSADSSVNFITSNSGKDNQETSSISFSSSSSSSSVLREAQGDSFGSYAFRYYNISRSFLDIGSYFPSSPRGFSSRKVGISVQLWLLLNKYSTGFPFAVTDAWETVDSFSSPILRRLTELLRMGPSSFHWFKGKDDDDDIRVYFAIHVNGEAQRIQVVMVHPNRRKGKPWRAAAKMDADESRMEEAKIHVFSFENHHQAVRRLFNGMWHHLTFSFELTPFPLTPPEQERESGDDDVQEKALKVTLLVDGETPLFSMVGDPLSSLTQCGSTSALQSVSVLTPPSSSFSASSTNTSDRSASSFSGRYYVSVITHEEAATGEFLDVFREGAMAYVGYFRGGVHGVQVFPQVVHDPWAEIQAQSTGAVQLHTHDTVLIVFVAATVTVSVSFFCLLVSIIQVALANYSSSSSKVGLSVPPFKDLHQPDDSATTTATSTPFSDEKNVVGAPGYVTMMPSTRCWHDPLAYQAELLYHQIILGHHPSPTKEKDESLRKLTDKNCGAIREHQASRAKADEERKQRSNETKESSAVCENKFTVIHIDVLKNDLLECNWERLIHFLHDILMTSSTTAAEKEEEAECEEMQKIDLYSLLVERVLKHCKMAPVASVTVTPAKWDQFLREKKIGMENVAEDEKTRSKYNQAEEQITDAMLPKDTVLEESRSLHFLCALSFFHIGIPFCLCVGKIAVWSCLLFPFYPQLLLTMLHYPLGLLTLDLGILAPLSVPVYISVSCTLSIGLMISFGAVVVLFYERFSVVSLSSGPVAVADDTNEKKAERCDPLSADFTKENIPEQDAEWNARTPKNPITEANVAKHATMMNRTLAAPHTQNIVAVEEVLSDAVIEEEEEKSCEIFAVETSTVVTDIDAEEERRMERRETIASTNISNEPYGLSSDSPYFLSGPAKVCGDDINSVESSSSSETPSLKCPLHGGTFSILSWGAWRHNASSRSKGTDDDDARKSCAYRCVVEGCDDANNTNRKKKSCLQCAVFMSCDAEDCLFSCCIFHFLLSSSLSKWKVLSAKAREVGWKALSLRFVLALVFFLALPVVARSAQLVVCHCNFACDATIDCYVEYPTYANVTLAYGSFLNLAFFMLVHPVMWTWVIRRYGSAMSSFCTSPSTTTHTCEKNVSRGTKISDSTSSMGCCSAPHSLLHPLLLPFRSSMWCASWLGSTLSFSTLAIVLCTIFHPSSAAGYAVACGTELLFHIVWLQVGHPFIHHSSRYLLAAQAAFSWRFFSFLSSVFLALCGLHRVLYYESSRMSAEGEILPFNSPRSGSTTASENTTTVADDILLTFQVGMVIVLFSVFFSVGVLFVFFRRRIFSRKA